MSGEVIRHRCVCGVWLEAEAEAGHDSIRAMLAAHYASRAHARRDPQPDLAARRRAERRALKLEVELVRAQRALAHITSEGHQKAGPDGAGPVVLRDSRR